MIRFECDCGAKLKVNDDQQGMEFDCPKCGTRVAVPLKLNSIEVTEEPIHRPPKIPQQTLNFGSLESTPINGPTPMKKRSSYRACRRLQFVLRWSGILCIPFTLLGILSIAVANNEYLVLASISWTMTLIAGCFINLALAELLGGVVAFFVKNECYP